MMGSSDRRAHFAHADALTPVVPHYALDQDKLDFCSEAVADLFYGGGRC